MSDWKERLQTIADHQKGKDGKKESKKWLEENVDPFFIELKELTEEQKELGLSANMHGPGTLEFTDNFGDSFRYTIEASIVDGKMKVMRRSKGTSECKELSISDEWTKEKVKEKIRVDFLDEYEYWKRWAK